MSWLFRLMIFFFFMACGPSPSEIWLDEYQKLLIEGAKIYRQNPYSDEMREVQSKIANKEVEIDTLLRITSMQEQMSFLSKYYDLRVNYFYNSQQEQEIYN